MSGEFVLTCAHIYNECNYAPLSGDDNAVPVYENDRIVEFDMC